MVSIAWNLKLDFPKFAANTTRRPLGGFTDNVVTSRANRGVSLRAWIKPQSNPAGSSARSDTCGTEGATNEEFVRQHRQKISN